MSEPLPLQLRWTLPTPAEPALALVEISAKLFLAGQFEAALAAAEPRLAEGEGTGSAEPSRVKTSLW